jgi:hydroxymethylglutaryl-CoA synthase
MKSNEELIGKRILVFSYGSGLASCMFSLTVTAPVSQISTKIDINNRLQHRTTCSPQQFTEALQKRERMCNAAAYSPTDSIDFIFPGTCYLGKIDDKYKRHYFWKEEVNK